MSQKHKSEIESLTGKAEATLAAREKEIMRQQTEELFRTSLEERIALLEQHTKEKDASQARENELSELHASLRLRHADEILALQNTLDSKLATWGVILVYLECFFLLLCAKLMSETQEAGHRGQLKGPQAKPKEARGPQPAKKMIFCA